MRNVTWADLEPASAEYVEIAVDRKIANTRRRTQHDAENRAEALHWLYANAGHSLMGLGAPRADAHVIRAVVLTEPLYLQIPGDKSYYLPTGTDVQALYVGGYASGQAQQLSFDLPDPALGVRAVPPFCARIHNGQPLLENLGALTPATFTSHGQIDVLMAMRDAAERAGANGHIADIDQRLMTLARSVARFAS